jgi:hypothetical protein
MVSKPVSVVLNWSCPALKISKYTRCGYEVPGMILLQTYGTCILKAYWEGSHFKYSPWTAMHLAQRCCLPLLETFLELLLWNSFQCHRHTLFGCLQCPDLFVPLKQTSFLEGERSHSEPNRGDRVGRERLVSWSFVLAENPIVGSKFRPFSMHSFT